MAEPSRGYARLRGSERRPRPGARLLGPADPAERLTVMVRMRRRPGGPPLPDHAYWMGTPPGKRRFLTTDEFVANHGAAPEDLRRVAHFARRHGLTVAESSIAGRTVTLSGTVAQMSGAFAVEMGRYQTDEETYRGRDGFVHVPGELADIILGVFGLDNRRGGHHNAPGHPNGTTTLFGGPPQIAQLYNFPPVPAAIGSQIIGVIAMGGGWVESDIQNSLGGWGVVTAPTPVDVLVTGTNNPGVFPDRDSEVILDISTASSIAPGAAIQVYWGQGVAAQSPGVDWLTVLNRIITPAAHDPPRPTVLTNSWVLASGDDADTLAFDGVSAAQVTQISAAFQELAALGVTVFSASGDDGSRSNARVDPTKAHLQYPGSDPWVTSCGGTTISTTPSFVEWVWNDDSFVTSDQQATGGGISAFFTALPPWQQGVVTQTSVNDGSTGRGAPDVAGNGNPNSGYLLTVDGKPSGPFAGTSAVAPLYAGLAALINASLGQSIGFLNPTLYAFGDTVCRDINDQLFPSSPQDNGVGAVPGYPSLPGWDACTGLGVIDGSALLAALQGVFVKDCRFILDRTQFGKEEVAAAPQGLMQNAFYVVVDGFNAAALGITKADLTGTPNAKPALTASFSGMNVVATALLAEDVSLPPTPQRFTWVCAASFPDLSAFTGLPRNVTLTAQIATVSGHATITLVEAADPFELDGPVSWLSTDLRVFQMKTNGSLAGLPSVVLTPTTDAPTFIKAVIAGFNANTAVPPNHPFDLISIDEQVSEVTLDQNDSATGLPIYNFAVARVRYQSTVDSGFVRAFFRIFQAATTSTAYDTNTYGAFSDGTMNGFKIPVFGVDGAGDVVSIPCFADARVAAGTALNMQHDASNTVPGGIKHDAGGAIVYTYFGCWLDINQPMTNAVPLPPISPNSIGPFGSYQSVLQTIRGQHQCLVAEISYDDDPVVVGETPASSDKLAQRNLAIVSSANPGNPASHRIPHTFDIRPTPKLEFGVPVDELMIDWGNTPAGSTATVYLPGVNAASVLALATRMYSAHRLREADAHTLECEASGATWIPVPQGVARNFAGLLTIDLPATVRKGQAFTVVARQVTSDTGARPLGRAAPVARIPRRVLGAFQVTIPVRTEDVLLEPEGRLLAIMRWIAEGIPAGDRWSPVVLRYIAQIADRVAGFGGDPSQILPSPTGSIPQPPGPHRHRLGFTGKIAGLVFDRFGDFDGFLLETEHGEHPFESREAAVHRLVERAWQDRIRVTVFADRDAHHRPESFVLRAQ